MSPLDNLLQPFGFQTSYSVGPTGVPPQVDQALSPPPPPQPQPQQSPQAALLNPQPQPQPQPDVFTPTQISPHQAHLDRIAMRMGRQPVYQTVAAQHDLTTVMQDYDPKDPLPTIHKIAQIPGMATKAYEMYQQYQTNQERDDGRDVRTAAKKDLIFQRLGGMAGAATEKNFPAMQKLMRDYVKRWGENPDDYDIPDSYNKGALDALSGGSISAKDQAAEAARQQALALRQQGQEYTQSYRERRLGQIDTAEGDRNDRFNEGQDRTDRRHDNPVARPKSAPYVGKIIDTPQGKMELSPSGLTGKIGDQIWQKADGKQWTRIK